MPTAPPGIGNKLRTARLDRELSIEETAWRTRMRPELLRALEEDEFGEIGHQAFVRSHLSSYARFLGIDPGEVVTDFEAQLDEPLPSAIEELDRRRKHARKPPRAKWLVAAVLSGITLIAGAVTGVLGGQAERPATELVPAAVVPPIDEGALADALVRVRLRLEAAADTQVSVIVDGDEVFEGLLTAGETRSFRARRTIEVFASDGGTILVAHGDGDLAVAGESGELFRARYGRRGVIEPADPAAD